jgi:serpin B
VLRIANRLFGEQSIRLSGLLKEMGIRAAFDEGRADFTGIAKPLNQRVRLCIGEVFHKAFVRVDEKGTEAAAAAGAQMRVASARRTEAFTVDHPFLFLIRDNASGLVLFIGRVGDPSAR